MKYRVEFTVGLNMSKLEAWDKLKDLSLAPFYVPGVESMMFLTENKEGPGASRRVYPMGMDETVLSWIPGREILLGLSKNGNNSFFPFRNARFRYSIEDINGTVMKMSLEYDPMLGVVGQLLFGYIIQKKIEKTALGLMEFYTRN